MSPVTDFRIEYIQKLKGIMTESVPIAFKSCPAKDEMHVQDIAQAILAGAKEKMDRESPQIPFAAVSTKPDFSKNDQYHDSLFLEFKHIKNRQRLNHIVTEMTSRVTIYRDQGAWVLFVVHDPQRHILEDFKFVKEFEKNDHIFVSVVR